MFEYMMSAFDEHTKHIIGESADRRSTFDSKPVYGFKFIYRTIVTSLMVVSLVADMCIYSERGLGGTMTTSRSTIGSARVL